jgi:hypothetical protein
LSPRRLVAISFGSVWIAAVAFGLGALFVFETGPGSEGNASPRWPESSGIPRSPDGPTLVMAAHPQCSCTRASLGELARMMATLSGKLEAHVILLSSGGAGEIPAASDLWRIAEAIPGVTVIADPGGVEIARFGLETSGHTLLYGRDGALLFSGGITSMRGHEGDNAGRSAIVELVEGRTAALDRTRVFGCALHGPAER